MFIYYFQAYIFTYLADQEALFEFDFTCDNGNNNLSYLFLHQSLLFYF